MSTPLRFLVAALLVSVFGAGMLAMTASSGESASESASGAVDPVTTSSPTTTPVATTPVATTTSTSTTAAPPPTMPPPEALPPSGEGRRVVFSISGQRMWWVDGSGEVLRTGLVSGRANTPTVGTFQVFSKSERATGLDGSRMDWFVRFTHGPNGWAIGFHDIPRVDGVPVQTEEQLGEPLSHGCIRQSAEDARFTWDFLDVGSTVVVVA